MSQKSVAVKVMVLVMCMSMLGIANNINSGGMLGVVRSMSSYPLGLTGLNVGGGFKYDRDISYVTGPGGSGEVIDNATGQPVDGREAPHIFSGNLFVGYGLFPLLDMSIDVPLYYDITGWNETNRAGVGDVELAFKFTHPHLKPKAIFTPAYYLKFSFPTGNKDRGYFPRHSYYQQNDGTIPGQNQYTADAVLFNPMLIYTLDFNHAGKGFPMLIHGNVGGAVTTIKNSSAILGNLAFEYSPVEIFTLFLELSGEARVKYYSESFSIKSFVKDPFIITPGGRLNLPMGLYITIAGDLGLSSRKAEYRNSWNRGGYSYATSPVPKYGFQVDIGWTGIIKPPDSDGDGLIDKKDACPDKAEDKDGFKDDDGCPDLDNDADGIADANDKCPDDKATCDGCPVYDTDNDGILDDKDKCPKKAEDMDNFEDEDGCPELDNDGDGVPDDRDGCPDKAEDIDSFEDENGCPDPDNDGDGIPDETDKCPNRRGVAEAEGCPKTKEIKRGKLVLSGVNFQSGKAILTPNSYRILDQVYESLAEWTEVRLEIQGYTDSQGGYESNRRLSQRRAESVMNYMIDKGISIDRLKAIGFGEDNPIADNTTARGRAKNRRVELNRID